ncbi:SOS response-associated peptidase [Desulfobulbus rhabdoformis]|jgi:putative SOS response-associated peptidase YedK|uniref:SOS response-associated peptidase n=1 Tax=Desulfobulbus rhabdoformis TaxID=34032 RepID=UPI001962D4D6|nr:SOS response-associated peptidase [Desulfobulbus rhabdoformis]MBM9615864.1 SOS response-associated peptidase [Desulfobulbus rhabdoformis]
MCGRFAYFGNGSFGYESLSIPPAPQYESYNIAPGQNIPALIRLSGPGRFAWAPLRWGLLPSWSKSKRTKFNLINARAEGLETKPSFRGPFRYRRCIIPANGYYEWQKHPGGKQPYYIHPTEAERFAFAGLWDSWESEHCEIIDSCTIITTTANKTIAPLHERMPVILSPKDIPLWLSGSSEKKTLLQLLRPCPEEALASYAVSTLVNNIRNNTQECIQKIANICL